MKIRMMAVTKVFLMFLSVVLGVTGGAKLFAVAGGEEGEILDARDWVLMVPNRQILWIAGVVEIAASFYLFAGRSSTLRLALMLGLFYCFGIYRLMSMWIGAPPQGGCLYLGFMADPLGIPQNIVNWMLLLIWIVGWLGSFILFVKMLARMKTMPPTRLQTLSSNNFQ